MAIRQITEEEYQVRKTDPFAPVGATSTNVEPTPAPIRTETTQAAYDEKLNKTFSSTPDPVLPTVSPSRDTSPMAWLAAHPWMQPGNIAMRLTGAGVPPLSLKGALGSPLDIKQTAKDAVGLVKDVADLPVQFSNTLASGIAGVRGNRERSQELLKPQDVPVLGEVQNLSGDPRDVATAGTKTPLQIGMQAAGIAATGLAGKGVKAAEKGVVLAEERGAKKALSKLIEYVSPKQTATTKEAELLANKSGKMKAYVDKGATRLAEAAKGIVDPAKRAEENIRRVGDEIAKESDKVRTALRADKKPFNTATFVSRLKKTEMPAIFKTEKSMENAYNLVIETAEKVMAEAPKTREGAWEARKVFDNIARDQFGSDFLKSDARIGAPVKEAIKTVRRTWNGFIGEGVKGDAFKAGMKRLSALEDVAENIAEKNVDEIGMGTLEFFKKKHPAIYRALQVGLGGAGAYTVGKGALNTAQDILGQ